VLAEQPHANSSFSIPPGNPLAKLLICHCAKAERV
jgi:hypothetical protein